MINICSLKDKINEGVKQKACFLFAIDFEMKHALFIPSPNMQNDILWRVGNASNFTPLPSKNVSPLLPDFIGITEYKQKFDTIYKGIYRGDSFLTNLTVKTPLIGDISMKDIALRSKSKYLLYLPNKFVCFSPEPFIKVTADATISSYPMKGTINADIENAQEILLADNKESCEHFTIVDLIRNDLSIVATNVKVDKLRYIDKLHTNKGDILQMSSKISGTLRSQYQQNYGDMLLKLLPAGSVSGAPKPSTLNLIKQAEKEDRGFYCGVFGYFNGTELDCAVMIRYIEHSNGQYYYRSGGGITNNSKLQDEYDETLTKIYITQ